MKQRTALWTFKGRKNINKINFNKVYYNSYGTAYKIVAYKNCHDITVEFIDKDRFKTKTFLQNVRNGTIKNPYDLSVYKTGYIGEGNYKTKENGKPTIQYHIWISILQRCYSNNERDIHKYKSYHNICTVCDEWKNYQTFAEWYDENFYDIGEGRMHLDKDILIPGNKVYAPDRCMFVPQRINMIFMDKTKLIDADLPVGIKRAYTKNKNIRYTSTYNGKYLGTFNTLKDAEEIRLIEKRKHIRKIADEYKGLIPDRVYKALIEW